MKRRTSAWGRPHAQAGRRLGRKTLAFILSLVLCLSMLPATALAVEKGHDQLEEQEDGVSLTMHSHSGGTRQSNDTEHWMDVCSICGNAYDREIHSAQPGNCTVDDIKCEVCGYVITDRQAEHRWSGWEHDITTHKRSCQNSGCGVAQTEYCSGGTATCTKFARCSTCGGTYGAKDSTNHDDLQMTEARAATMTAEGNIEYWYCVSCEKYYKDSTAEMEISQESTVIAKLSGESGFAKITLINDANWEDENGYQMLLDANANTYGRIIPTVGPLARDDDVKPEVYELFEYKLPENADGMRNTKNMIPYGKSASILIPAGSYDYCITTPEPGRSVWIATSYGDVPGRGNDHQFEAGKHYIFHVLLTRDGDIVNLIVELLPCTVTFDANGGTLTGEGTATSGVDGRVSEPTAPTRDGYTFDGWYLGDTKYDFTAPVTQDITLTAQWKKNSTSSGHGSSSSPTYSITAPDKTENGSVTVDAKSAKRGSSVTITVTPDKGYTLETLTVLDKDGKEISVTKKSDTQYTFTMPSGKVEVKASFMDDNTMLNYFVDVKASDDYYDAVLWAAEKGITSGTDATHFSPSAPCTRAQIVTFLWRAAGSPVVNYAMNLSDVAEDAYYAEAVRWALSEGITNGTGEGTFSPDAVCTRAQSVTFLHRAQGQPTGGRAAFADVPADSYYAAAVAWAVENGVTNGISQTLFGPEAPCTRAQIVTFLYRAAQNQ